MKVKTGPRGYSVSAAMNPYLRVKLSSGVLAAAGIGDIGIGTLEQRVLSNDTIAAVIDWNAEGTRKVVVAGAVAQYALLYPAAGGKWDDAPAAGGIGRPMFMALAAASGDGSIIEALPLAGLGDILDVEFSIGTEATDAIVVGLQIKDAFGNDITKRIPLKVHLLADANGDAYNAVDYTIAAGTDGAVAELVADKVLQCLTEDDGDLDISLTVGTGETVYLGVELPGRNDLVISGAVTHAA